jgi:tetratricopeptide (TPR) repeat protein
VRPWPWPGQCRTGTARQPGWGPSGGARICLGDRGGVADLERCVGLYQEHGSPGVIEWQNNLAYSHAILGELRRCSAVRRAAVDAAQRNGSVQRLRWLELEQTAEHYWSGRWDQATVVADSVTAEASSGVTHYLECDCCIWRGRIRLARGQLDDAREDALHALELARASNDRQHLDPALAFGARTLLATSRTAEAGRLVDELLEHLPGRLLKPELGVDLPACLVELGHPATALNGVLPSRWLEAAQAYVAGERGKAADLYAAIGSRPDEAYARLEAARHLIATNQVVEATTELAVALAFYRSVRASALLEETDKLVATMLSTD